MIKIFRLVNVPLNWLEHRLNLKSNLQRFLNEPIPDKVGWPHVFGGVLLALFAVQFLSGILLSFIYSPSPGNAFESIRYISEQMKGGLWLRAIHYWGTSLMVIVLGLHLLRTFLYAAYRKPREATWIVGVLLLLCMLAFAQTGFLLPWDQMAYWGTEVTIRIIETTPLIGSTLGRLLRGGDMIGVFTLSRFYSFHVVILPVLTTILVAFHIFLIRHFGITPPWTQTGEETSRSKNFYPYQTAKDAAAMFLIVAFVFLIASLFPAPLGVPADPTDNTVAPRPEWYFLFLFQLLHYFQGKWEIVGTFLLPNLGVLALLLVPFIDRNPGRHLRKRPVALFLVFSAVTLWGYLTWSAAREAPKPAFFRPAGIAPPRSQRIKRSSEVGGLYVLKTRCLECHSLSVRGEKPLQILALNQFPAGAEWLQTHLKKNGRDASLSEKEVTELMSVLRVSTSHDPELLSLIPPRARFGAHTFYNNFCINCHTIDGQGGTKGPDLTVRPLRTKEWYIQYIRYPQSLVPNSKMQEFPDLTAAEYDALAEYLLYLHSP